MNFATLRVIFYIRSPSGFSCVHGADYSEAIIVGMRARAQGLGLQSIRYFQVFRPT